MYFQDPTFEGLQQAYKNIIYSAWYNYTNFGSDIGKLVIAHKHCLLFRLLCLPCVCTCRWLSLWWWPFTAAAPRAHERTVYALVPSHGIHAVSRMQSANKNFIYFSNCFCFCRLMENGGDNEHRPWMFDDNGTTDTTDNYRMFVNAHLELGMVDAQPTY